MLRVLLLSILITLSSGFVVGLGGNNKILPKVIMKDNVRANFKSETYAEYMARRSGSNKEIKKVKETKVPTYAEYMKSRNLAEDEKRLSPSVLQKLNKSSHHRGLEGDN
tara:strand:+ start:550 stop:876 length:327 start_codon:yes stop_codon:yes gene_type:complete